MININIKATTPTATLIYKSYILTTTNCSLERYVDVPKFSELCKSGCVNYDNKWSCPPYAPTFTDFTANYKYIVVCILSMELQQFAYIKNDYLKVRAANTILKSRIDKTLRRIKKPNNHYISTGSCRLCKPCKCKINEPCAHTDIKAYSFEAMGMNVSDMVKNLFGYELLWYKKNDIPQYTSVVAGLVSNQPIDEEFIMEVLKGQN